MPAPSAPARVSAVPHRLRLVCGLAAGAVVVAMAVVGLLLPSSSTGVVAFGPVDQAAMIGLGVFLGLGILTLGRSRVDADITGIRVRNVFVPYVLPWAAVREVRFDRSSPWATLALRNGDDVALLAVQAVDRESAVVAVEGLRALLDAAQAAEDAAIPVRPPLLYED